MARKTDTKTLIETMRILARDINSQDGVANAAISEAADRLEELLEQFGRWRDILQLVVDTYEKGGWPDAVIKIARDALQEADDYRLNAVIARVAAQRDRLRELLSTVVEWAQDRGYDDSYTAPEWYIAAKKEVDDE